jgi:leucyl-tRNA synthetase
MGPLDAGIPWSEDGLEGARKFLDRAWRLIVNGKIVKDNDLHLERIYHETVKNVTDRIEGMLFNTAISQLMIFVNAANKAGSLPQEYANGFVQLLAPFAPHLAEELWVKLGNEAGISYVPWPTYDEAKLIEDEVEVVVQVNGKLKARLNIEKDLSREDLQIKALAAVKIEGVITKVIAVPNKLVNIVVKK